ncbi:hypothetical protein HON52_01805 [Candidatus Uhrbacteria bacterium]|jgi:uncharacterized protein YjaZ|nr:hypothetical protein [Candidatus Uhrbacteria bacterium]
MAIKTHILNSAGHFDKYLDRIKSEIDNAFILFNEHLTIDNIDVIVENNPPSVIPEVGSGGYSSSENTIYLYLDVNSDKLEHALSEGIRKTILHEGHHCLRWQSPGYGETLFEALVTEGLADHFQLEVTGGEAEPWATNLTTEELVTTEKMAKKEFHQDYNHAAWFYGSDDLGIKKWTGYSLGFKIIKRYKELTKETAADLVNTPASKIFERLYSK